MSPEQLKKKFFVFRSSLLEKMSHLSRDSPDEDIWHVNGIWKAFRREVSNACSDVLCLADPRDYFEQQIYPTAPWIHFAKLRTRAWQRKPQSKKLKRAYAKKHYETRGKAARGTPEAREKLNAQRRARYARAKSMALLEPALPEFMNSV